MEVHNAVPVDLAISSKTLFPFNFFHSLPFVVSTNYANGRLKRVLIVFHARSACTAGRNNLGKVHDYILLQLPLIHLVIETDAEKRRREIEEDK